MFGWIRRALTLAYLFGLAFSAQGPAAGEHCRGSKAAPTEHHHSGHPKDTDPSADCPHCPPIECRRHSHCAGAIDAGSAEVLTSPRPQSGPASYQATAPRPLALRPQPPTPPPQLLG